MSLTYTPRVEIGAPCPEFRLPGTDGRSYSLQDFSKAHVLVVMFICNHCPYVKAIEDRLIKLGHDLLSRQSALVAICSNDSTDNPEDSFVAMKARALEKKYPFPYLHDESQQIAQSFGAVCTPDFFVFKKAGSQWTLQYRARLDDSWKDPQKVQKQELLLAVDLILQGQPAPSTQIPSMGCNIKWKAL